MWAGHMAQQIKVLTRKRECLGLNPRMQKNGKKEETTASCALTFIYVLWPVMHIYIHTHTQKQRK